MAALALLVTAKSADAWMIYHRADRQIAETRAVMQLLPRGARLLVVNVARGIPGAGGPAPSTLWNMPMVAVIDHDAFLPTFFSGVSTVHIRAPLRVSSTPNGFPITPAQLRDGISRSDEAGRDIPDGQGGGRLYHYDWPAKFDYVLIQCFGMNPGPLPENLKLLAHSPNLDLYSIRHN